ncbi:MAG: SMP-30/gluconolactonase/LRE family protein [Treponema sp.]|jgi:sugar lactone lactonase YvrE|nr:SMP-30/gluconolactonase/LRE family protein [Treponema sp.]
MKDAELFYAAKDKVGEGPNWNSETGKLYWVDISGRRIHIFDPATKTDDLVSTDDIVAAMAFDKSGKIVAALSNRLVRIDPETRSVSPLYTIDSIPGNARINDGKCDAAGRFWLGTMDLDEKEKTGSLYSVSPDLTCKKVLDGLVIGNGMAWTADNKTMYYIDSPTLEIWAFDFDLAKGELSGKRTVIKYGQGEGMPDGMTIDTEGMLWIAQFRGAQVSRWNPRTGKRIASYPVPTYNTTSCCFGGKNFDELFITSASVLMEGAGESQRACAGSLFHLYPGVTGTEAFRFGG